MWIINLLFCLLIACSAALYPNLFDTGGVDAISFRFADRNMDNKVNLVEFKTEITKYDANYDGQVSESELSNCIIPWPYFQTNGVVTNFQPAFNSLDANSDGFLSFEEARNP